MPIRSTITRPRSHVHQARARTGLCLLAALILPACNVTRITDPPRTATEQFLMSYAAIQAVADLDVAPIAGRRVFLDTTYFESFDQRFMVGEIRARLAAGGVYLVGESRDAEVILEARSAGVGIDRRDSIIGIPSIPIPIPGVGTIETPELALYKDAQQTGEASFALLAFESDSREFIYATGPAVGLTDRRDISLFGLPIFKTRTAFPHVGVE